MESSVAARKPLDVGTGRVCASFGATSAGWLSLGAPHAAHGFVELAGGPPFDERRRGSPAATRAHRERLALADEAFLAITDADGALLLEPDVSDPYRPAWRGPGIAVEAWGDEGGTIITQHWSSDRPLRVTLGGRLDRPALAEITELDPPASTGATTELHADGTRARVVAPALPAAVTVELRGSAWRPDGEGLVADMPAGEWIVTARIGEPEAGRPWPQTPVADPLVTRALAYVRGCTALSIGPDERVILTDHRLLPLSWTRDAYWQARLLLAADGPGDRQRVADHLRWLWRRCERPDGRWVRSHHANGRRKDRAFQADQQLYPLVELADYWRLGGSLPDGVNWTDAVAGAWDAVTSAVDPSTGLMATHENAADDPAEAPFIAASQILLWHAAGRLTELHDAGALTAPFALGVAERVRAAFGRHLVHDDRWAYASDGAGNHVDYHDANDLPLALAPAWGFCTADDPAWVATVDVAFSARNPGYAAGPRGGLGSVHTAGAWTLGDVQRWIVARATGDADAAEEALQRLRDVAFLDGMLPEAYSATGHPDVRIRHWFAWPGAALGALLLAGSSR